jgi:hypothetical protein
MSDVLHPSRPRRSSIRNAFFLLLAAIIAAPLIAAAQSEAKGEPETATQPAWTQTTFYEGFNFPRGLAVDKEGDLYVADYGNNRVVKVAANGKSDTITAANGPTALAIDSNGDVVAGVSSSGASSDGWIFFAIFIVNTNKSAYSLHTAGHTLGSSAGMAFCGSYLGAGPVGTDPMLYASGGTGGGLSTNEAADGIEYWDLEGKFQANIPGNVVPTGFTPRGLACDAALNLYIVDGTFNQVWKMTPKGVWSRVGSGYNRPEGVAVDSSGNVFVTDRGSNQVVEVTPAGVRTSFGTGLSTPIGIAVYEGKSGDEIFVADAGNNRIVEFTQP